MDVSTANFVRTWRRVSYKRAIPEVSAYKKLMRHPRPDIAIKQLKEYIAKWPKDALAHYSLGILQLNVSKDPVSALKSIETSTRLKPTKGFFHVDLALALLAMKSEKTNKRAIEVALHATELLPHAGESWCTLAAEYGTSKRVYESIRSYKKSLFYDSNQPAVHRNLGHIFRSLSQKRDAAEHYKQSLILDPHNRQAYIDYSNVLVSLRKTDEAARVLEEMTKYFSNTQKKLPVLIPRHVEIQQRIKEAAEFNKKRR